MRGRSRPLVFTSYQHALRQQKADVASQSELHGQRFQIRSNCMISITWTNVTVRRPGQMSRLDVTVMSHSQMSQSDVMDRCHGHMSRSDSEVRRYLPSFAGGARLWPSPPLPSTPSSLAQS